MGEHGVADTYNNQRKEQEVKRDVSLFHSQRNNLIYFHLTLSTYKCELLLLNHFELIGFYKNMNNTLK